MYYGGAITRRLDNGAVVTGTPTPEMLAEWGFELYTPLTPQVDIRKQRMVDDLNRVRLCSKDYQVTALILNHMERYHREDMNAIKERFNNKDLYTMLELLHEADLRGRNEYARMVTEF